MKTFFSIVIVFCAVLFAGCGKPRNITYKDIKQGSVLTYEEIENVLKGMDEENSLLRIGAIKDNNSYTVVAISAYIFSENERYRSPNLGSFARSALSRGYYNGEVFSLSGEQELVMFSVGGTNTDFYTFSEEYPALPVFFESDYYARIGTDFMDSCISDGEIVTGDIYGPFCINGKKIKMDDLSPYPESDTYQYLIQDNTDKIVFEYNNGSTKETCTLNKSYHVRIKGSIIVDDYVMKMNRGDYTSYGTSEDIKRLLADNGFSEDEDIMAFEVIIHLK